MEHPFLDAHIHIQDIKVSGEIDRFLDHQRISGQVRFFNCSITPADWPVVKDLSQKNNQLLPFFGIHPWFSDLADEAAFQKLEEYLSWPAAFAGEMGLDRSRKNVDLSLQIDVFSRQLELACRYQKPFALHCVRAWDDALRLIKKYAPGLKFLAHSFYAPMQVAHEIHEMGGFFSVPVKEFLRPKDGFCDVFQKLPLERILLESDFPYQLKWTTPEDYRNELDQGYQIAASWKGLDVNEFVRIINDNGTIFTH